MSESAASVAPSLDALFPLPEIRRRAPYLSDTHPKTFVRWALRGVLGPDGNRVRLQHARAGRRMLTTEAWLAEFFAAQGSAQSPTTATAATEPRGQSTSRVDPDAVAAKRAATRRRLADAGIGAPRRRGGRA